MQPSLIQRMLQKYCIFFCWRFFSTADNKAGMQNQYFTSPVAVQKVPTQTKRSLLFRIKKD